MDFSNTINTLEKMQTPFSVEKILGVIRDMCNDANNADEEYRQVFEMPVQDEGRFLKNFNWVVNQLVMGIYEQEENKNLIDHNLPEDESLLEELLRISEELKRLILDEEEKAKLKQALKNKYQALQTEKAKSQQIESDSKIYRQEIEKLEKTDIPALEAQNRELERTRSQINNDIQLRKIKIKKIEADLLKGREELDGLKKQEEQKCVSIDVLVQTIDEAKANLDELEKNSEIGHSVLAELNEKIKAKEAEIKNKKYDQLIQEKTSILKDLEAQQEKKEKEVDDISKNITDLRSTMTQQENGYQELVSEYQKLVNTINAMLKTHEGLLQKKENLDTRLNLLIVESDDLNHEIKTTQEKIAEQEKLDKTRINMLRERKANLVEHANSLHKPENLEQIHLLEKEIEPLKMLIDQFDEEKAYFASKYEIDKTNSLSEDLKLISEKVKDLKEIYKKIIDDCSDKEKY